jgi:hypothetical protein
LSKVIRAAVTSYLATARTLALEEQHRKGYEARPRRASEIEMLPATASHEGKARAAKKKR